MSSPNRSVLPLTAPNFTPRGRKAGVIYHTLNRGNDRNAIFKKPEDYDALLHILDEAKPRDAAVWIVGAEVAGWFSRRSNPAGTTAPQV